MTARFSNRVMRRRGIREGRGLFTRVAREFIQAGQAGPAAEAAMEERARWLMDELVAGVRSEGAPDAAVRQFFAAIVMGFAEASDSFRSRLAVSGAPANRMQ